MKEIILKSNDSEIIIDSNISYYLFSKFFMFFLEEDNISENYIISQNQISDLRKELEIYLTEILKKWYKEPNEKYLQKHPSRYEKIGLNMKIYKVNYRMSEIGRLIFIIYNLLKMFDNCCINNENLNIKIRIT